MTSEPPSEKTIDLTQFLIDMESRPVVAESLVGIEWHTVGSDCTIQRFSVQIVDGFPKLMPHDFVLIKNSLIQVKLSEGGYLSLMIHGGGHPLLISPSEIIRLKRET
jgi:hypothetical protein